MQDNKRQSGVDKGLIAMFLKMSAEKRLLANDNAVIILKELRLALSVNGSKKYVRHPSYKESGDILFQQD